MIEAALAESHGRVSDLSGAANRLGVPSSVAEACSGVSILSLYEHKCAKSS